MAQPLGKQGRSVRLFAFLVRILPSDFRVRHGSQMVQTFQDCRREVVSRGGSLNLVRFWRNAFADLLWTALILHTERFTMSTGRAPTHLAILFSAWVLFQRISAANQWLARFRPYPKAFRNLLRGSQCLQAGHLRTWRFCSVRGSSFNVYRRRINGWRVSDRTRRPFASRCSLHGMKRKPTPAHRFSRSTSFWAFSGQRNQSSDMFLPARSSQQLRP